MRFAALLGLVLLAAACREQVEEGPPPVGPELVEQQRALCEKTGGRFAQGGRGSGLVCYRDTDDNGKQCSKKSDCEGECLARSGTCSPVTPLFGCNEVLTEDGARTTLCVD